MTTAINLSGSLIAGPLGSSDCGFPATVDNIPITTSPTQKAVAESIRLARSLNSPSPTFVTLEGVGPTSTIVKGVFLYLRAQTKINIRVSTKADSGPDVVSVIPVQGTVIMEFPDANYLTLLEASGVSQIEYLVGGGT
jgi:hypothetical protein